MLKQIAKALTKEKIVFTRDQLELMLQHANDMLRKDLEEEFSIKLETIKNDYKEKYSRQYVDLEKKYNKLIIANDILKGKINAKAKEEEKILEEINDINRIDSLAAEIFS